MKNEITVKVAANITYSGFTYNTPLIIEYQHTGKQWFFKPKKAKGEHFTQCIEIVQRKISEGLKVREENGYYFIKRLAIPTINAKGEKDIWYINNAGDSYSINKVSKYAKKIHQQLSNNINPFN
jgi:hypothetical protein